MTTIGHGPARLPVKVGVVAPVPVWATYRSLLRVSVLEAVATLAALAGFGYMKGTFTGMNPLLSAGRTTIIGGLAAGAAYGIARAIAFGNLFG